MDITEQLTHESRIALAAAAEITRLRAEVEALRGITPELPPRPPDGGGLPRYGLRHNGQSMPMSVPMADGYWTPYHLAIAEVEALRAAPQQAEPVGYFVNDESDDQWHQVDYEQRNGADTYPLYLHPPAAEVQRLRAAALALLNELDAGRHGAHEFNELRNAARAAQGGE